ncbi:MAG: glycosyltransferase family 39 protein [Planctomycetia bacterium]|nr:glycosyltransferase family 39 protein [Planctomycetia bacterium]
MTILKQSRQLIPLMVLIVLIGIVYTNAPVQSEDAHLASGLSHWRYGTYTLYRVNPPMVRSAATLPLYLFCEDHSSWKQYVNYPLMRKEYAVGVNYLEENKEDAFRNILIARSACMGFLLLGLTSCYFTAKSLGGKETALIAVLLLASSPYFLGHGATIMPDAHAAGFAVAAVLFFFYWLKRSDSYEAFMAGTILGLAEYCVSSRY